MSRDFEVGRNVSREELLEESIIFLVITSDCDRNDCRCVLRRVRQSVAARFRQETEEEENFVVDRDASGRLERGADVHVVVKATDGSVRPAGTHAASR